MARSGQSISDVRKRLKLRGKTVASQQSGTQLVRGVKRHSIVQRFGDWRSGRHRRSEETIRAWIRSFGQAEIRGSFWRFSFLVLSQKNSALSWCHFAPDDFAENSLDESFLAPPASQTFVHECNSRLGQSKPASCYQDCCDFCNRVVTVFINEGPSGKPRHSNVTRAKRELLRCLRKEATSLPRTMRTDVS
jgi:hypothetical protein